MDVADGHMSFQVEVNFVVCVCVCVCGGLKNP